MTMVMKISLLDAKSSIGFNNALSYTTRFSHTERMRKQHIVWPDKICEFMVAIILKAILDVENFSLLLTFSPSTSSYSRSYIKKKKEVLMTELFTTEMSTAVFGSHNNSAAVCVRKDYGQTTIAICFIHKICVYSKAVVHRLKRAIHPHNEI